MHSIISVDFLCDPSDGRVLDEFVAFPLQTDGFLCFCPTVWIHPITEHQRETTAIDNAGASGYAEAIKTQQTQACEDGGFNKS